MSGLSETGLYPVPTSRAIKRVAILFAGGPAPAANAVISTAAASFRRNGIEVIGIMHGYAHLIEYRDDNPMKEGRDYIVLDQRNLRRTRNTRGILIGTSRTNPGKDVSQPAHLADPKRTAQLRTVHRALASLGVNALVSIGGDDTLKTANKFKRFQDYLPADEPRIAVVHVPKTIDNDYRGIDFTFGYFTAVETLAGEIRNLLADAEAGRMYFLVETMGRSAGWLAYGAAIASEASLVLSVEDLTDDLMTEETLTDPKTNATSKRRIMHDRKDRRSDRHRDDRPRDRRQGVWRHRAGGGPGSVHAVAIPRGREVRRSWKHFALADEPGAQHDEAGRGRIREAARQETARDRSAARLRGALCPAPRVRRDPGQPARRRGLSCPGGKPRRRCSRSRSRASSISTMFPSTR